MRPALISSLLMPLVVGCGAEDGANKPSSPGTDDTANVQSVDTDGEDTGGDHEICDGIDNDGDGVVDNGLEYAHYWPDADGDGYGGPTGFNCSDLLEDGQEDGVYEIWPNGKDDAPLTVYCEQETDGGGWARVFRHDVSGGYFASNEDAFHHNEDEPNAELYSILRHIDRLRNPDGSLESSRPAQKWLA